MDRWTLLMIHGVGNAAPGATLLETSRGLRTAAASAQRSDLVIDGVTYPRLALSESPIAEIIEINWTDIARPRATPLSVADYAVRIVAALLAVASRMPGGATMAARLYYWSFEALLVFCIYPSITVMLCLAAPPGITIPIGLTASVVVAGLTLYLKRFGGALSLGGVWAAGIAVTAILRATGGATDEMLVNVTASLYIGSQAITGIFLFAALTGVATRRAVSADRRIATTALLYFPLFILSALGALLWAISFMAVQIVLPSDPRFDAWQKLYSRALDGLGYDLRLVEFTFAALVALVGAGFVAVGVVYNRRSRATEVNRDRNAGALARDGVRLVLAAGGALFAALSIVYVVSSATGWHSNLNTSVLRVYSISALRFLPYLTLVVGPLATVTGIIVDVLFYIADVAPVGTAETLRARFRTALEHAARQGARVVVAGHSQGSVIAVDVVGQAPASAPELIVTAGSPLDALYQRFLGSTPETRLTSSPAFRAPSPWINFSRRGDYIGAAQNRPGVEEIDLGGGGHTGYWREAQLWDAVLVRLKNL